MSVKVLLVSHGGLAAAAAGSARMITGDSSLVTAIGLTEEGGVETFRSQVAEYYKENHDFEILSVCDIPNGTPYITACSESQRLLEKGRYAVLAGLNLGMLLELTTSAEGTLEELKRAALEAGAASVTEYQPPVFDEMEEEL